MLTKRTFSTYNTGIRSSMKSTGISDFRKLTTTALLFSCGLGLADELVVELGNRPITIETTGTIVSTETTHIGTPPSTSWSQTISFLVAEGKKVKKGELLVKFSSSRQEERVKDYSDDLKIHKGELESLIQQQAQEVEQEKLDLAEAESIADKARRKTELPADIIPSTEYERLVEERRVAEIIVEELKNRKIAADRARVAKRKAFEISIKRLQSRVTGAQEILERLTVHSPRDAVAIVGTDYQMEKLDVNSRAHPGLVVVYLIDESKLAVKANVPENLATKLKLNQQVRIVADNVGGADLAGVIDSIGNTVRRESRFSQSIIRDFWVKFETTPPENLKVGMAVKVTVQVDEERDAIAVPPEALVYRVDTPGAIVNGNWRELVLGDRSNGMFIVRDGLTPGDKVQL